MGTTVLVMFGMIEVLTFIARMDSKFRSLRVMFFHMGRACMDFKIFKSIVRFVSIDMMDNFIFGKNSTEMFSHYISMFKHWFLGEKWRSNKNVSLHTNKFTTLPISIFIPSCVHIAYCTILICAWINIASGAVCGQTAINIYGKLDCVGVALSSSTLPTGSTNYFQAGSIVVKHGNGTTNAYNPTSNTDVARGDLLVSVLNSFSSRGDSIYLPQARYDMGTSFASLAIGGSGSKNLYGEGIGTVLYTQNAGAVVVPGSSSTIKDVTLIMDSGLGGHCITDTYGFGSGAAKISTVTIENVWCYSDDLGIYHQFDGTFNIYNSHFITDNAAIYNSAGIIQMWDSELNGKAYGIYMDFGGPIYLYGNKIHSRISGATSATALYGGSGDIYSFGNDYIASDAGSSNYGVHTLGSNFYSHADNIQTSGASSVDLLNGGGSIFVDNATVYYSTKTSGTINYLNQYTTSAVKAIRFADGTVQVTSAPASSGGGSQIYPATATARFPFGFSASTINTTGEVWFSTGTDWFTTDFNFMQFGSDPGFNISGLPLRFTWSNPDSGNNWMQFDDGAGGLGVIKANINADSILTPSISGSPTISTDLTVSNRMTSTSVLASSVTSKTGAYEATIIGSTITARGPAAQAQLTFSTPNPVWDMDLNSSESRLNSRTSSLRLQATGLPIFRGVTGVTNVWTDAAALVAFQIGASGGNILYSALNGSLAPRTAYWGNSFQWSDSNTASAMPVPVTGDILEVIGGGIVRTRVTNRGVIYTSSQTVIGSTSTTLSVPNTLTIFTSSNSSQSVGGSIFQNFVSSSNNGTTETDLYSNPISSNTLISSGDRIEAWDAGSFLGSATATRQIKVYIGTTVVFDSGALAITSSGDWKLERNLIRSSANEVRSIVTMNTAGASTAVYASYANVGGLAFTGNITFKITGTAAGAGAATGDIQSKLGGGNYFPVK